MKNPKKISPLQLCLFSPKEMADMVEVARPVKVRTDRPYKDWLLWELSLLPALTGQWYRDQFALLSGRVNPIQPKNPVVQSDILLSYDSIIDRVRPTLFLC